MKIRITPPHSLALAALLCLGSQVFAQTTWNQTAAASYSWTTPANWNPAIVPNGTGAVVNINNNIAVNQTITVPATTTTLGTLNFGDSDGLQTFNLTANTLTFEGATPGAATALTMSTAGTAVINSITAGVTLGGSSPLTVTNNGAQLLLFKTGAFNVGTNALTFDISNTTATAVSIESLLSGTGALTKNGKGVLQIRSDSIGYSGPVTVNAGQFIMYAAVGKIDSISYTINGNAQAGASFGGSELLIGSGAAAPAGGRINDNAVITLQGGGMKYSGSSAVGTTSETIKEIVAGAGRNLLTMSQGNVLGDSELKMTSLTRKDMGTLEVRAATIAASGASTSRILITGTAPILIGGNGGANTTNISILPWAIGGATVSNDNYDFVTYDAATGGLRYLLAAEYNTGSPNGVNNKDNYTRSADPTISSNTTINSLKITGTSTAITVNSTLTLTSGALSFAGETEKVQGTGILNFGGAEGVIWSGKVSSQSISAVIAGSNGMTKAGSGNLTISAANTYGGTTTISGGTLTAGAVNTLPTGTAVVLSNSTVSDLASPFAAITTALNLNGNSQTIGSLAGGGTFGGNVLLGSATLTTGGANSSTSYGGIISGAGGGLTKAGTGVFTVTGANTYTGATTVSAGTLLVSGTGSINSTSGIVIASNSILRYNSITAYSGGAITNSGVISGSGNLGSTVLGGSGSIDPGNSPGILTAGSTNPTGGLDYNFEFTAKNASPTWSNATDSGNDVLRLTGGTPFSASLTTSNVISLYLNVTSLAENDVFTGGFFTDNNASFLASISGADTKYYLMNAGGGTPYNGVNYNLYSGSLTFTMATVAKTADFASGTIPGYSMQFTAVPEPATWALLAFSLTTVMVLRRRHRE